MIKLVTALSLILALFSANVNAEELTATFNDRVKVTISDQPCDNKVKSLIKPEYLSVFQRGSAVFEGKTYELCWTAHPSLVMQAGGTPGQDILVVDETQDYGTIPAEIFKQGHKAAPNKNLI